MIYISTFVPSAILMPCLDINECASNGGRGPCDQICTNTNGSFLCSCQLGYTQNGYSCIGESITNLSDRKVV